MQSFNQFDCIQQNVKVSLNQEITHAFTNYKLIMKMLKFFPFCYKHIFRAI